MKKFVHHSLKLLEVNHARFVNVKVIKFQLHFVQVNARDLMLLGQLQGQIISAVGVRLRCLEIENVITVPSHELPGVNGAGDCLALVIGVLQHELIDLFEAKHTQHHLSESRQVHSTVRLALGISPQLLYNTFHFVKIQMQLPREHQGFAVHIQQCWKGGTPVQHASGPPWIFGLCSCAQRVSRQGREFRRRRWLQPRVRELEQGRHWSILLALLPHGQGDGPLPGHFVGQVVNANLVVMIPFRAAAVHPGTCWPADDLAHGSLNPTDH
mmetsp:Transcript_75114/g.165880  ORF Transcript_75114/g.165880 Transcript_75114/m.165880 type:complete len:269 (-) Transcript_75114:30-836(-)